MKPCVCAGTNSNCRYCSGSGYVANGIGLPRPKSVGDTWAPQSEIIVRAESEPGTSGFHRHRWPVLILVVCLAALALLLMAGQ